MAGAEANVAMNLYGVKMRVSCPGRAEKEVVHCRKGETGKGATTRAYVPANDMPTNQTASILASREEREGNPNTMQVLVVGLVVAEDPEMYLPEAKTFKSKAKLERLEQLGVLERPSKVLRAVIPVSEYISKQAKYYVLTNLENGLYDLRTIKFRSVFVFREFWDDVQQGLNLIGRESALSMTIKTAAAKNKSMAPVHAPLPDEPASTVSEAVAVFYDTDTRLTAVAVWDIFEEFQAADNEYPDLDARVIARAHPMIVRDGISNKLHPEYLPIFFLALCGMVNKNSTDVNIAKTVGMILRHLQGSEQSKNTI